MSLLTELERRNVIRTAGQHLAGAWRVASSSWRPLHGDPCFKALLERIHASLRPAAQP